MTRYCQSVPVKLDSPLFADTASGRIRGVGSFRQTLGGTFLIVDPGGNTTPDPAQQQQRDSFADAKAAHSAIFPSSIFVGGRHRQRRIPSWPDFWAAWVSNNPGFSSRRANLQQQIGDFGLATTAQRGRMLTLADGQIGDFGLAATVQRGRALTLANGQIGDFGLTATVQVG